jgi:hypothetical protein
VVLELREQILVVVVAQVTEQTLAYLVRHQQVVVEVVVLTLKQVHQVDQVAVEQVLETLLGVE